MISNWQRINFVSSSQNKQTFSCRVSSILTICNNVTKLGKKQSQVLVIPPKMQTTAARQPARVLHFCFCAMARVMVFQGVLLERTVPSLLRISLK